MTVATLNSKVAYNGTGSQDVFQITFQYFLNTEVSVFIFDTLLKTYTLKTPITHFNFGPHVSGSDDGVITFTSGNTPLSTDEVHIERDTSLSQDIDFTPRTKFPNAPAEEGLDRGVMRAQEAFASLESRALRIPKSDLIVATGLYPDMELPNTDARSVSGAGGGALHFDNAGLPIIAVGVTLPSVSLTAFGTAWVALADAAAARDSVTGIAAVFDKAGVEDLQVGLEATRAGIATADFEGFFFATDTQQLWYSDKTSWEKVMIGQYTETLLPAAPQVGVTLLDTDNLEMLYDDGVSLAPFQAPWPRGAVGGGTISITGGDEFTIQACESRAVLGDASRDRNLITTSAFAKTLNVAADSWVLGTGNAGNAFGTAQAIDTWYYIYEIGHRDGRVDFAIDTSKVAAGILNASGAIRSAGFDAHVRRVGAFYANIAAGGTMVGYVNDGDYFTWTTATVESFTNGSADYTSGVLVVLDNAPPLTRVHVRVVFSQWSAGGLEVGIVGEVNHVGVPNVANGPLWNVSRDPATDRAVFEGWIRTDSSKQIKVQTGPGGDTTVALTAVVLAWIDDRDRYV